MLTSVVISSWGLIFAYALQQQHRQKMRYMMSIDQDLNYIKYRLDTIENYTGKYAENSYNIRNTLGDIKDRMQ